MVELRRCFVAVPIPDEIRMALADVLSDTRFPGRFSSPQRWHITLRFLGEIDDITYERFLNAFEEEDLSDPFRVTMSGLGAFPGSKRAKVVWAGITDGTAHLEALSASAEEAAETAGLEPEDRPFRPHLTLSVLRPAQDVTGLLHSAPDFDLSWKCDQVIVYESHLGRGPARYEPLETFRLG